VVAGRIGIDDVAPVVSGGRYPAKAVVGEVVPVRATVWREGHDVVAATLVVRYHGTSYPQLASPPPGVRPTEAEPVPIEDVVNPAPRVKPQLLPMRTGEEPDVFYGQFVPDAVGLWTFRVDGWGDPIATWRKAVVAKLDAGQGEAELNNDLLIGAKLLERAATGLPRQDRFPLIDAAARLREPGDPLSRASSALAGEVTSLRCGSW
jgi:starch synthase (maltosyl-transferring)